MLANSQKGALMELSLATRSVSDRVVLEIGGEIDVYTAPRVRERLVEMVGAGDAHIVVDLGRVDFLDSTGLGVLVGAHRRVRAGGGSLNLVCPHERLLKIFRITGLDTVFEIHSSVDDAITGGSAQTTRTGA
ncbi:MAG: anti-sigma factor antagonist [Micromonosporaceae bacterium]|jgi:anti-sigma B factor antagonist|nr:anti-sigma factor antagonist [Micromonosporaceae bacterium]